MKTMRELIFEAKELELKLESTGGELDPVTELELYQNELDVKSKTDSCAAFMEHLSLEVDRWTNRKNEATLGLTRAKRRLEYFEEYLKYSVDQMGGEVKGDYSVIKTAPTAGNLIIIDKELIPMQYKKEVVDIHFDIDNKAIKEDLSLGIPVPGAELKINQKLTIKPI